MPISHGYPDALFLTAFFVRVFDHIRNCFCAVFFTSPGAADTRRFPAALLLSLVSISSLKNNRRKEKRGLSAACRDTAENPRFSLRFNCEYVRIYSCDTKRQLTIAVKSRVSQSSGFMVGIRKPGLISLKFAGIITPRTCTKLLKASRGNSL